jgi:aryl-alcohol dehydrogenase-like predicted oxidoreductase
MCQPGKPGHAIAVPAPRDRINHEIEESLQRLRTDHINIYQVHWPDPITPIEETAEAMRTLFEEGKMPG